MAKYQRFEELPVWQDAARLYNLVMDLLELPGVPLTAGFRNQLDRAALSVSNNIAEGYERLTTSELLSFIAIARGSAGEVRSMIAAVQLRERVRKVGRELEEIKSLAESCARQLKAWAASIEDSRVKGKRYLNGEEKRAKSVEQAAREFREKFLRGLKVGHPLYGSEEARRARGEAVEE
jgi:four helix bundle protein